MPFNHFAIIKERRDTARALSRSHEALTIGATLWYFKVVLAGDLCGPQRTSSPQGGSQTCSGILPHRWKACQGRAAGGTALCATLLEKSSPGSIRGSWLTFQRRDLLPRQQEGERRPWALWTRRHAGADPVHPCLRNRTCDLSDPTLPRLPFAFPNRPISPCRGILIRPIGLNATAPVAAWGLSTRSRPSSPVSVA